jgi:AcrR family transcriptional regulator
LTEYYYLVNYVGVAVIGRRVRTGDVEGRKRRAESVLAAAADLIERWGYDKTTIDDVARAAGIAKGTIYLHWKSRDALFVAVLRRERMLMLTAVREGLAAEQQPGPRAFFRHLAAAMIDRPLLRAVLLHDLAVLGRLAQKLRASTAWRSSFTDYLEALRNHRALHEDSDERRQLTLVNAAFIGVLTTTALMPEPMRLSTGEQADLIADVIDHTLGLGGGADPAALSRATTAYCDAAFVVAQQELAEAIGLAPSDGGELE